MSSLKMLQWLKHLKRKHIKIKTSIKSHTCAHTPVILVCFLFSELLLALFFIGVFSRLLRLFVCLSGVPGTFSFPVCDMLGVASVDADSVSMDTPASEDVDTPTELVFLFRVEERYIRGTFAPETPSHWKSPLLRGFSVRKLKPQRRDASSRSCLSDLR